MGLNKIGGLLFFETAGDKNRSVFLNQNKSASAIFVSKVGVDHDITADPLIDLDEKRVFIFYFLGFNPFFMHSARVMQHNELPGQLHQISHLHGVLSRPFVDDYLISLNLLLLVVPECSNF